MYDKQAFEKFIKELNYTGTKVLRLAGKKYIYYYFDNGTYPEAALIVASDKTLTFKNDGTEYYPCTVQDIKQLHEYYVLHNKNHQMYELIPGYGKLDCIVYNVVLEKDGKYTIKTPDGYMKDLTIDQLKRIGIYPDKKEALEHFLSVVNKHQVTLKKLATEQLKSL